MEQAKRRKADHQGKIEKTKQDIAWLKTQVSEQGFILGGLGDAKALRRELKTLRERNLNDASFKEKADLVIMLRIKFCPAEDLRSWPVVYRLNLTKVVGEREQGDSVKVVFCDPNRI